jgi:DNA/RNA-binding domain of Phe-tRNA-synthetase-like protein
LKLTIAPQVTEAFPKLRVLATVVRGVKVDRADSELRAFIETGVKEVRERHGKDPSSIRSLPSLSIYDDLLRRTGEDKIRSAVESMIRRLGRGEPLPSINNVVDLCNLVMAQTLVAVGAFDLDRIQGDAVLRIGERGEKLIEIGRTEPRELVGGEVVLSDLKGVFSIITYRDSDRTKITQLTRNVLLFTAADSDDRTREASLTLRTHLEKLCEGKAE